MISTLYDFPESTYYGRILPKKKIYQHANPGAKTKELFVRQIDQIIWQYKLSPDTLNIDSTETVPEIQVFDILLKDRELDIAVLRAIDISIPFPVYFQLHFDNCVKPIAAYKRPNSGGGSRWILSDYFSGVWVPRDVDRTSLPIIINLEELYRTILEPLMPYSSFAGEHIRSRVERMERIRLKQREIDHCESRLQKEKQFNRKVEINAELRDLKQEFENLTKVK